MFETARRLFRPLLTVLTGALMIAAPVATPTAASAQGIFNRERYAAIVVDAQSGEVLYAKRADAQRFPASITKIMTMYLAFESLATHRLNPSDIVVMTPHAAAQAPSKLGLRPGEGVTLDMALQAIAVKSANDMAVAVAERIAGSEDRFAQLMTLRARELGMNNTHFANASGLPNPHNVSTARDIAILSRAVMRDYPQYYGYFGEREFSFRGQQVRNHNGLLRKMPGVDGLKTGYIGASGFNLAASAQRDGHRLIAVVLGGSSTATRDENVESLLNAGFEVLHRRALGQRITLASIAEPEDNGPIQRPSTEEGDGEQDGVQVQLADSLRGPPVQPDALARARAGGVISRVVSDGLPDRDCTPVVRYEKRGRGRHARRIRVVTHPCKAGGGARRVTVAEADPCLHKHGRAKRSCERTAARHHGRHEMAENEASDAAPAAKTDTGKTDTGKTDTGKSGGYLIQVGAYKTKADAHAQIAKVNRRFGKAVASADPVVQRGGGGYRARFAGFSAAQAKAACRTLSAKGERCMVISAS